MSKRGITLTMADVEAHQIRHGFLKGGEALRNLTTTARGSNGAPTSNPKGAPKPFRQAKQPNKTESEFGRILEARKLRGEFDSVTFEAVKLRIAGNCYYAPDYMAVHMHRLGNVYPVITFFEVKGAHIWDDSKVKFRAAAERHSWAEFQMWQKKQGEWRRIL